MKSDHMERFVVLPFSIGCASHSSVSVAATCDPKRPKSEARPPFTTRGVGEGSTSKDKMKNPSGFMFITKPNISYFQKLIKSIKSLSQIFVYKEEETEDIEREMEIGYPTDVKHVTHIGLDGSSTTNPVKGWEELKAPEIFSFPSFSLAQLEIAMSTQQPHGDPSKLS